MKKQGFCNIIIWLLKNEYDVEVTRATDGKLVLSGDATKLTHAMKVVSNVVGRMKNGEVIDIKKFNCLISLEQDGALELEISTEEKEESDKTEKEKSRNGSESHLYEFFHGVICF